ncbi:MAG: hypothetical protein LBR77_01150 [Lachnospiraceae bacterium]|jgi:hypothetical protein|nr:hypothetical protein [Lachnospiraceae bacterium]
MGDLASFLNSDLFSVITALPLLFLCMGVAKSNFKKELRHRQWIMPVLAFLWCCFAIVALKRFQGIVDGIANALPALIGRVAEGIRPGTGESVADRILDLLPALRFRERFYIYVNTAMVTAYLVFKGVVRGLLALFLRGDNKPEGQRGELQEIYLMASAACYDQNEEAGRYELKNSCEHMRSLSKALYYTVFALSALALVVGIWLIKEYGVSAPTYPVLALILAGEVYFFLDGMTGKEFAQSSIEGEVGGKSVADFIALQRILHGIFGDKSSCENTQMSKSGGEEATVQDALARMMEKDEKSRIYADYIKGYMERGKTVDRNLLSASLDLLDGKNVLFSGPFYQDLIPYAFYPMNRVLLSGRKALVICGRHGVRDEVMGWLEEGLHEVTGLRGFWRLGCLGQGGGAGLDVAVVSRSEVTDVALNEENRHFLHQVGYVAILEPSKLITTAQVGLNLIAREIGEYSGDEGPRGGAVPGAVGVSGSAQGRPGGPSTMPPGAGAYGPQGVSEDGTGGRPVTYVACDKMCDGLVDALSHALMANFTEVSPPGDTGALTVFSAWNADSEHMMRRVIPEISRYLGFGTELGFVAARAQVDRIHWYGGEAFPVTDMHWIGAQYLKELSKYTYSTIDKEAFDERFIYSPDMWGAGQEEIRFDVVEDESYNLFEVYNDFATRSTQQGYVNVVSPAYLLRDYMAANQGIFEADRKAIPCISADFARTPRNIMLRILLLLTTGRIPGRMLERDLALLGEAAQGDVYGEKARTWPGRDGAVAGPAGLVWDASVAGLAHDGDNGDITERLWRCILGYCGQGDDDGLGDGDKGHADGDDSGGKSGNLGGITGSLGGKASQDAPVNALPGGKKKTDIIKIERRYNYRLGASENLYYIDDGQFIARYVSDVRSADYITENELGQYSHIGSELYGHIFQKHLPGQMLTYAGKYYEMVRETATGKILLRRSADHITGRPQYRQLREYELLRTVQSQDMGDVRELGGVKLAKEYADFAVSTDAYWEMAGDGGLKNAHHVKVSGIPKREYRNKQILRIEMPGWNTAIRHTLAVMLNEVFLTLFAENSAYICAVTDTTVEAGAGATIKVPTEAPEVEITVGPGEALDYDPGATDGEAGDGGSGAGTGARQAAGVGLAAVSGPGSGGTGEAWGGKVKEPGSDGIWGIDEASCTKTPGGETGDDDETERARAGIGMRSPLLYSITGDFGKESIYIIEDSDLDMGLLVAVERNLERILQIITDYLKWNDEMLEAEVSGTWDEPTGVGWIHDVPVSEEPESAAKRRSWLGRILDAIKAFFGRVSGKKTPPQTGAVPEGGSGTDGDGEPGADGGEPGADGGEPGADGGEPGADGGEPGADGGEPEVDGSEPGVDGGEPVAVESEPGADGSDAFGGSEAGDGADADKTADSDRPGGIDATDGVGKTDDADESGGTGKLASTAVPSWGKRPNLPVGVAYSESYYLLYGYKRPAGTIDPGATLAFLEGLGYGGNYLYQARHADEAHIGMGGQAALGDAQRHQCDFCGRDLSEDVQFDVLTDGRERCGICSRSAIKSVEEFVTILKDTMNDMERLYRARITVPVKVKMTTAAKISKENGRHKFVPTPGFDSRAVGLAISDGRGYTVLIENGVPRVNARETIMHELTHIWQYTNWDMKALKKGMSAQERLELLEGMATWVGYQYLFLIGERDTASNCAVGRLKQNNEYGRGLRKYLEVYKFCQAIPALADTPFDHVDDPLQNGQKIGLKSGQGK